MIDNQEAKKVLEKVWGISGEAERISGERDLNFRIIGKGKQLLKYYQDTNEMDYLTLQDRALTHLKNLKLVPELIKTSLPSWLSRWLATFDLSLADIEHWAIHPGGPKIMDAVIEALELSPNAADCSRDVLKKYGNMSSPTSLFVLQEMQNRSLHGYCVMLGFGPGLAVEAALLKL